MIKFYTSPTLFFKQEVKVYVIGSRDPIQKMALGKSTLWEHKKQFRLKLIFFTKLRIIILEIFQLI